MYTTPFVLLLVAARLQGFDASLERAASDLGANTFNRLRYVVLPLLAPAILAGALFAFTLSLDEFIITLFLIGSHNTLPIYIYTQVKFGITPEVNALAALLLAASLCLMALAFVLPGIVRRALRLVPRRGYDLALDRDPAAVASRCATSPRGSACPGGRPRKWETGRAAGRPSRDTRRAGSSGMRRRSPLHARPG